MHSTTWEFDVTRSRVEFRVRHMMVSTVVGRFPRWRGTLEHDPADPLRTRAEAVIELQSVETGDTARDDYLRTSDLLDLAHYPQMQFSSKSVTARGDAYVLEGLLTIRGTTRPVRLDVTGGLPRAEEDRERVTFEAKGVLRRKEFGLTWSRFVEAGGLAVSDDVEIVLHVEATRRRDAAGSTAPTATTSP
jgi:polyisoprenoid-binding protein YceI